MATVESVMNGARTYMRDRPKFFAATVTRAGLSETFKLPHPHIMEQGLRVVGRGGTNLTAIGMPDKPGVSVSADTFAYLLDEGEALMRISRPRTGGFDGTWAFNVEGYYFNWLPDNDLRFFADNLIAEHAYLRPFFDMDNIPDIEEDAMSLGVAVEAFWSILMELALDIDVITPEGVHVQATQRYSQVQSMLLGNGGLLDKYRDKSQMIGVGMHRVEMIDLRRVSRTTGRLVPVYESKEWDDHSLPHRIFPPIDRHGQSNPQPGFRRWANGIAEIEGV